MTGLGDKVGEDLQVGFWLIDARDMARPPDQVEIRPWDQVDGFAQKIGRGRFVLGARNGDGGQAQATGRRVEIRARDGVHTADKPVKRGACQHVAPLRQSGVA